MRPACAAARARTGAGAARALASAAPAGRARTPIRFDLEKRAVDAITYRPILSVHPDATASEAAAAMARDHYHTAVVTDGDAMAGLLTERDFLTKLPLVEGAAVDHSVADLMTPASELTLGSAECSVDRVVRRMRKERISSFPLLEDGIVKAVINKKNIAHEIFKRLDEDRDAEGADVSVGDMLAYHEANARPGDVRGTGVSLPPYASLREAVELMRETGSGSLSILAPAFNTFSSFVVANNFGLFTEREYVAHLPRLVGREPDDVELFEVARFSQGASKKVMKKVSAQDGVAKGLDPRAVVAISKQTPVRDCLSLMLGNDLLYAPVTEDKKPVDIVSLRDINLFLAPTDDDA